MGRFFYLLRNMLLRILLSLLLLGDDRNQFNKPFKKELDLN